MSCEPDSTGMTVAPKQLHPVNIGSLPLHIRRSHVNDTLHSIAGGYRRAGHAMLSRAGLGDYPRFAHAPRQQRLSDGIVDLMRAGMVQVFALQQYLCAA